MTQQTATASRTPVPTDRAPRETSTRDTAPKNFSFSYFAHDLRRNLRMISSMVFILGLPVALYLIFGSLGDYSTTELPSGNGNVTAGIMVSMAVYGAIVGTVSIAGSAAIELSHGWGRQLGLTPFTQTGYVFTKVLVSVTIALLPIAVVFVVGSLTGARVEPQIWPALIGSSLIAAVVFALYGLMFGLLFRSEAAVSAASGLVVILMFLGNGFTPLSGFLLDMSPFTPVWGAMTLAQWPLMEGQVFDPETGAVQYELWMPILNIVAWASLFGLVSLWASRRHTARK